MTSISFGVLVGVLVGVLGWSQAHSLCKAVFSYFHFPRLTISSQGSIKLAPKGHRPGTKWLPWWPTLAQSAAGQIGIGSNKKETGDDSCPRSLSGLIVRLVDARLNADAHQIGSLVELDVRASPFNGEWFCG